MAKYEEQTLTHDAQMAPNVYTSNGFRVLPINNFYHVLKISL